MSEQYGPPMPTVAQVKACRDQQMKELYGGEREAVIARRDILEVSHFMTKRFSMEGMRSVKYQWPVAYSFLQTRDPMRFRPTQSDAYHYWTYGPGRHALGKSQA